MNSVYIHIPFCKTICSYCDFCKLLYNGPWITKYLNSLLLEINDNYNNEPIKTLYIGGGTPSSLQEKDLKYLFTIINKLNLSTLEEFTFECNINDINENLVDILVQNKVNRVSIGIESFNKDKLNFMERECDFDSSLNKINLLRKKGINNINVDLIYGIPSETLKDLEKDLDLILKLNPDHISTYSLIIEDNTKIKNIKPIDEEIDAKMYELILKKLKKKYHHYEVSNFAISGKESQHNLNYWNNEEYYGFGLGASGYIHGVRYTNTRNINEYFQGHYKKDEEVLSKNDIMYNELMLGFRKTEGINLKHFFDKFGINLQEAFDIRKPLNEDEIRYENGYLFINPEYIYVMNEILINIL